MSQPVSAFAVYTAKRKHAQQLAHTKKQKKLDSCIENTDRDKSIKKDKSIQLIKNPVTKIKSSKKQTSLNGVRTLSMKSNLLARKITSLNATKKSKINSIKSTSTKRPLSQGLEEPRKLKSNKSSKLTQKKVRKKAETIKLMETKTQKPDIHPISYPHLQSMTIDDDHCQDPTLQSKELLQWMIHPLKVDEFFKNNWEKTPIHIKRNKPNYYKFLMSTPILDKILRESYVLFTKNIDITSYTNGVRETHNPPGRAMPTVIWDYYMNGCSIRMLNPQTFIPKLCAFNATLQEFFGCFVGSNSYLTPPNSQGFAPHYDDIEAFILQIEGKKRWRLYKPLNINEYLPRYSSKNFDQSEIGEPILDTVVNAGDLLYFPRGTIHQGETIDNTHSLHITLSVYQKNSWGDFLKKLIPETLSRAIENDSQFREGLPLDYLRYTGFVHSENNSDAKKAFKEKIKGLLNRMVDHLNIDKAADLMGRDHIHDFLPPSLTKYEQDCSAAEDGERMVANGVVENRVEIEPDTRIRLSRSHCTRLVEEAHVFRVYYSTENSKEYHEYEPQYLEVSKEFVPAIKEIISRYPEFVRVEDLPVQGEDNKIAKDLWEKCIVVTDHPLYILE